MKDSPQQKFYMSSFTVLDATVAEVAAPAPAPCSAKNWLTGELTQEECQTHTNFSITGKTHLEILELSSLHGNVFRERK